jgi:hypothetical protein
MITNMSQYHVDFGKQDEPKAAREPTCLHRKLANLRYVAGNFSEAQPPFVQIAG